MDLRMQHIFNQGAITMLEQMVRLFSCCFILCLIFLFFFLLVQAMQLFEYYCYLLYVVIAKTIYFSLLKSIADYSGVR